jgi:hypothetical protein
MYAAVEKLYRDGMQVVPQAPALLGQLRSQQLANGRRALNLWPLDWLENVSNRWDPLAVLWLPEFVGVGTSFIILRGLEEVERRPRRHWVFQKWRCEILDAHRAQERLRPDRRFGEV